MYTLLVGTVLDEKGNTTADPCENQGESCRKWLQGCMDTNMKIQYTNNIYIIILYI